MADFSTPPHTLDPKERARQALAALKKAEKIKKMIRENKEAARLEKYLNNELLKQDSRYCVYYYQSIARDIKMAARLVKRLCSCLRHSGEAAFTGVKAGTAPEAPPC